MKKLTSIVLLLLFSFALINVASAESQKCQKQKIAASYTGDMSHISQSCRDQEEFGSIVGFVFKWFIIIVVGFFVIMVFVAFASSDVDNKPKLSQKELEEKQARLKENKKKRLAKQKAELDRMTKIINENKAKKNRKN